MNHSNLKFIVDSRLNHPYGVARRLQFFANNAGKKLVILESNTTVNRRTVIYAVANS